MKKHDHFHTIAGRGALPLRSRRRPAGRRVMLAGLVALPVITAGIAGLALHLSDDPSLDNDYCLARGDQHISAVLMDNSMRDFSGAQQRDLMTILSRAWRHLPPNGRLELYTTAKGRDGLLAHPAASLCKPPSTETEREALGLPSRPRPYMTRQLQEAQARFKAMAQSLIRDTQTQERLADTSPLLEMTRSITMRRSFAQATSRTLYAITDGLQNSAALGRFCMQAGALKPFDRYRQRDDYALRIQPRSFAGADVHLVHVAGTALPSGRLPHCQGYAQIQRFWTAYFRHHGADVTTLHTIGQGGNL